MNTDKTQLHGTGIYPVNYSAYGGEITAFDFDGHPTITGMAEKICRDYRFDERCRKNMEIRELNKQEKEAHHD